MPAARRRFANGGLQPGVARVSRGLRDPLLAGRDFATRDTATGPTVVAIVNRTLARQYEGTEHAVGQQLVGFGPSNGSAEIVGGVGNASYSNVH